MAAQARKHPELRFITMSPGSTMGTEVSRNLPAPARLVAHHVLPRIAPTLGLGHNVETDAHRLINGITDPSLHSGAFYASAPGKLTGPTIDQANINPDLRNPTIQDHAVEAIHRFL